MHSTQRLIIKGKEAFATASKRDLVRGTADEGIDACAGNSRAKFNHISQGRPAM